ncbi:GtrA family protein [Phenylobacterium sp.]|uniref:GtrA family protein n=1 Tax=Phenylobacterium sp. TaxID=1871053 RepID=UPI002FC5862C
MPREGARQGGTFVIVGVAATLVHVAVALAAREALGLAPLNANLAGYCAAVGVSYLANARLTFRRPSRNLAQFGRFLAVSLLALGLNQALVYLLVERAGWPFWLALVPVVLAVPTLSFALSKLWAFRAA